MITQALHWGAVAGALCSAIGFVCAALLWLAGLEAICAVGLAIGFSRGFAHVTRIAQLLLLLQTVALGAMWPSAITIAALFVLPAIVLVVLDFFNRSMTNGRQVYLYASAFLAALSLAAEGWLLATIQRG